MFTDPKKHIFRHLTCEYMYLYNCFDKNVRHFGFGPLAACFTNYIVLNFWYVVEEVMSYHLVYHLLLLQFVLGDFLNPSDYSSHSSFRSRTVIDFTQYFLHRTFNNNNNKKIRITVWTVTVLTAILQSNGNGQTSTPHRMKTINRLR